MQIARLKCIPNENSTLMRHPDHYRADKHPCQIQHGTFTILTVMLNLASALPTHRTHLQLVSEVGKQTGRTENPKIQCQTPHQKHVNVNIVHETDTQIIYKSSVAMGRQRRVTTNTRYAPHA